MVNGRMLAFLGLVGAAPLATVLALLALLVSGAIGRDLLWRPTDSDLASAIRNDNRVALGFYLERSPSVDAPVPFWHPRIFAGKPVQLPPLAIALAYNRKDIVQLLLSAGSDPAKALGALPDDVASALMIYTIEQQMAFAVPFLAKFRRNPARPLTVTLPSRLELTPLELAAYHRDRWTFEAILDVSDQRTVERALHYAVENKLGRAQASIFERERNQRRTSDSKVPPLSDEALKSVASLAAKVGNTEALTALLEFGVDLGAGSPSPPICEAVAADQAGSIVFLLDKQGRSALSATCQDGRSPLELARHLDRKSAASRLEAAAGK